MSIHIMSIVWRANLPLPRKMVLLKIADCANEEGKNAYPSVGRLARDCSLSDRQVKRELAALREAGILIIQIAANPKIHHATTYCINVSMLPEEKPVDRKTPPVSISHPPGDCQSLPPVTVCHPKHPKNHPITVLRDTKALIEGTARSLKKMPSRENPPDYREKSERKARWQQKIIEEINLTMPSERAFKVVACYQRGEKWALDEFERVDGIIRSRTSKTSVAPLSWHLEA